MRVTSLKELDNYIYSSVVIPLKGLVIDPLTYNSPIEDNGGRRVSFEIVREEVMGDFHHNFQRNDAREKAKWLVLMRCNHRGYVVADYEPRRHAVRVYAPSFAMAGLSPIIKNKLTEAFRNNAPFGKVSVVLDEMRDTTVHVEVPF